MNKVGQAAIFWGCLALFSVPANAQSTAPEAPALFNDGDGDDALPASADTLTFRPQFPIWSWSSYGQFTYERFDFYENAQDTTPTRKGQLDLRRVVFEPSVRLSPTLRFQAEVEFEHGGTGSTIEFEPEEAGEFESEVEQGGEVILENAFLEFRRSDALKWRIGEMTVPIGMQNLYHRPDQHFTIERSLSEASVIPGTWHDIGISASGVIGSARYNLMVVRALDSTLFSGYGFVSEGSSQKLEQREANDFALVASGEYYLSRDLLIGGGFYHGDSAGNRARANLGTSSDVTITEFHGRFERGPITLRAQYLVGKLQNADQVTRANFSTYNAGELGVSRTSLGSKATSFFIEAGYDVLSFWNDRSDKLVLFARYDAYDTHASTAASISRNERYDRKATTIGVNYSPNKNVVFKGEVSRRENGGTTASDQDYAGLAVGFKF